MRCPHCGSERYYVDDSFDIDIPYICAYRCACGAKFKTEEHWAWDEKKKEYQLVSQELIEYKTPV